MKISTMKSPGGRGVMGCIIVVVSRKFDEEG